jgi:hypothetical protein
MVGNAAFGGPHGNGPQYHCSLLVGLTFDDTDIELIAIRI